MTKCKYCGEDHRAHGAPFTHCHNPSQPLPDSLVEGYPYRETPYSLFEDEV